MIMHLHTSQSWYKNISSRKTCKLCHTRPTPRILHHVIFFLFPCLKKSFLDCKIISCLAFSSAVFQYLDHIPKEDYKHAFEQWIQRQEKCVAAQLAYFENMQGKNLFEVSERCFKSVVSFIPEIPSNTNQRCICYRIAYQPETEYRT